MRRPGRPETQSLADIQGATTNAVRTMYFNCPMTLADAAIGDANPQADASDCISKVKKLGLSGSAKGNLGPFGARSRGVALPT
jgi:hypothetical protein